MKKKTKCNYIVFLLLLILTSCTDSSDQPYETASEHNSNGLAHLDNQEYDQALDEFKKAIKLENRSASDKVMYLRNISMAFGEIGDVKSAIDYRMKALKITSPRSYDFYVTKGDIAILKENIPVAIENLEKAYALDQKSLEANNSLGLIYLGDYGDEYLNYQKSLIHNKAANKANDDSTTSHLLGKSYFYLDSLTQAEKSFQKASELRFNYLETKYSLGIVKYYLEKDEEARELLEEVISQDSSYAAGVQEILKDLGRD